MSVESELLRIQRNIANTYAAVSEKGGDVPLQPNSANLAAAVASIPAGGSSVVNWENVLGRPDLSNVCTMTSTVVVLQTDRWNDNQQVVTVPGVTPDENTQLIIPVPKKIDSDLYENMGVKFLDRGYDTLMFSCESIPTNDIKVIVFVFNAAELKYSGGFEWWSPGMTSNNTPNPYKVTASDIYMAQFQAYYAFDGNPQSAFHSSNTRDSWIEFDAGARIVINGLRITAYAIVDGGTGYLATPKKFTLYGSLDDSNWDVIYEADGTEYDTVSRGEVLEYTFPAVSYRYYKLVSHLNYQNNYYFTASEIEFSKME